MGLSASRGLTVHIIQGVLISHFFLLVLQVDKAVGVDTLLFADTVPVVRT